VRSVLFLLNDVVLDIDTRSLMPPLDVRRFQALSLDYVVRLGQELFAETPLLPRAAPERARRLAALLTLKQPNLNAALFVAPSRGCPPDQVAARFCGLSIDVIATLHQRQQAGALDAVTADREVWRRLAA
jgi:hypothetical protein